MAVVLVAAACGGGGTTSSGSVGGAGEGDITFTAPVLAGGEFDGATLEGADTVLWFWAPWCTVCRGEAPDVVAAADAFEGEVQIIGVAGRGGLSEMEGFVDDTGTGGLTHLADEDGRIWSSFGVFAQPAYAFVDDSGEIEIFVGALGADGLTERMNDLSET